MKSPNTKTRYGSFVLYLALFTFLVMLSACGSGSSDSDDSSSDTGSVAFGLVWNTSSSASLVRPAQAPSGDVCVDYLIEDISVKVKDSSDQPVASASAKCTAHSLRVDGVPVGTVSITVEGLDSGGNKTWEGDKGDIVVTKDHTPDNPAPAGFVILYYAGADTDPPTVKSTEPLTGTTGVAVNAVITATFDEDVVPESARTSCSLKTGSTTVDTTVTYDSFTQTVSITPNDALSPGTYTAIISTGVQDRAGQHMADNYSWSFDTFPPGTIKWTYATGVVTSSPAIGPDGTIYVSSMDGNVYLLNPDGTEKAKYALGSPMSSSPAIGSDGTIYVGAGDGNLYAIDSAGLIKWDYTTGDAIRSSPAIGGDGTIYVGSDDGKIYAINPDGSFKWSNSQYVSYDVEAAPVIGKGGTVYTGGDALYALYPDSGGIKWGYFSGGDPPTSAAIGDDGTLYAGFENGMFIAINADGSEKWSHDFYAGSPISASLRSSPAIGPDGTIYFGADYEDLSDSTRYGKLHAFYPDGTLKWSFTVGGFVRSSPAIASDGTVYVGSDDEKIYAINSDGTEKWSVSTGNMVRSSPVIGSDGTVYIGSGDGKVYAILSSAPLADAPWPMFRYDLSHTGRKKTDKIEGTLKWMRMIGSEGYSIHSSPAIDDDGTVYVGSSDGNLYAINSDGTEKWSYLAGGIYNSSPAVGSDGTVYIGTTTSKLLAVNPDGTQKWEYSVGGAIHSSPALGSDGTIYFGCNDFNLYALNPDGSFIKWTVPTGGEVSSSPSIGSDGTIYVGSDDGYLYAVNPDGSEKWKRQHPDGNGAIRVSPAIADNGSLYFGDSFGKLHSVSTGGGYETPIAMTGPIRSSAAISADHYYDSRGTVYVGAEDGKLYAISIDDWIWALDPKEKWSVTIGTSGIYSSPAIGGDGTVYIGGSDDKLYAINHDGTVRWSYPTSGKIFSSPAVGSDGTVYVVSSDGNLYAINGYFGLAKSQWPMFHHDVKHTGRK